MASNGVNKVILIGRLGQDPEIRYMPNGDPVANLSLATSETWKDKNTNEQREKTEWHRIVFYRRLAEIVGEYVKKGSRIYVEGRLQTRKWQDQQGVEHYTTEIIANEMQMLDSRSGGGDYAQSSSSNQSNYQASQQQRAPQSPSQPQQSAPQPAYQPTPPPAPQYNEPTIDFEDDIPF